MTGAAGGVGLRLRPGWIACRREDGIALFSVTDAGRAPLRITGEPETLLQMIREQVWADSAPDLWRQLEAAGATSRFRDSSDNGLSSLDAERFARQLDFFEDRWGDRDRAVQVQKQILSLRVGVVGVGGVGNHVIEALSALGVRQFRLADGDTVQLSNLVRQPLFRIADVGQLKTAAASRWIREYAGVEAEQIDHIIDGPLAAARFAEDLNYVIVTAGPIVTSLNRWFGEVAQESGAALIPVGGTAFGPIVRRDGACWHCTEMAITGASPVSSEALRDFLPEFTHQAHTPVYDAPLRVTAGRFADEFLTHLAGGNAPLESGIFSSAGASSGFHFTSTESASMCQAQSGHP